MRRYTAKLLAFSGSRGWTGNALDGQDVRGNLWHGPIDAD